MATVDVWLCAGQSNMVGRGNSALSPIPDPAVAWQWNYSNGFVPVADPVGSGVHRAQTGSMVPAFANAFTTVSGRPSVFVPMARGGTALLSANGNSNGDWSTTGSLFGAAVTQTIDACLAVVGGGHDIGSLNVLWHQGERDAQGGASLGSYEAAYGALVGRFRSAFNWPALKVYALQIGLGDPDTSGWQTVRAAQADAADATDGMELAYGLCSTFFARGWMQVDGLHYSQYGLNDMGAKSAAFALIDQGYPAPVVEIHRSRLARRAFMA